MSTIPLRDPIYQLNFVLWLLEPLPGESPFRPLFREVGYSLYSIGQGLPLAPEHRLQLTAAGAEAGQTPTPDVLAGREPAPEFLVVECKAAGFSPGSSTARQARGLLVASADLRGPIGFPPGPPVRGVALYMLPEPEAPSLVESLAQIARELRGNGLPAGAFSVLGLEEKTDGVYLTDRHPAGSIPADVEAAIGNGVRVHAFTDGSAWRPLYFIPWDPSVAQEPGERGLCQRVLFERVLAAAVSRAGRAQFPGEAHFPLQTILEEATFNLARRWRNPQDIASTIAAIRRFLGNAIQKGAGGLRAVWDGGTKTLIVPIGSREDAEALRRAVEEGRPAEWLATPEGWQLGLFDQSEGGSGEGKPP